MFLSYLYQLNSYPPSPHSSSIICNHSTTARQLLTGDPLPYFLSLLYYPALTATWQRLTTPGADPYQGTDLSDLTPQHQISTQWTWIWRFNWGILTCLSASIATGEETVERNSNESESTGQWSRLSTPTAPSFLSRVSINSIMVVESTRIERACTWFGRKSTQDSKPAIVTSAGSWLKI